MTPLRPALGLILASLTALSGCAGVTAGQVALSAASAVASRMPLEDYLAEAGIHIPSRKDHHAPEAFSDNYRVCLGAVRTASTPAERAERMDWCLRMEITDAERERLLSARAVLALENGDGTGFRRATRSMRGIELVVPAEDGETNVSEKIRGLASAPPSDAVPPTVRRLLLAQKKGDPEQAMIEERANRPVDIH